MKRYILLALAALSVPAQAHSLTTNVASAWVQYGPGGRAEVRAVARDAKYGCPVLITDRDLPMTPRAAPSADFPLICSAPYPAGAKDVRIGYRGDPATQALPNLSADPRRILVLGDTGCRIKGTALQACNDPKAWPFAALARAAADLKPDLVVHLGDYLYRESACPAGNAGCAGSPWGDNWAAWDADFFTPGAALLAAAPWVVIRGNHEDCQRAGPGFLRMLGPVAYDAAAPCIDHLDPYAVMAGSQTLAVMDTANASDTTIDDKIVPLYAKDYESLKAMANIGPGRNLWLVSHRPIWGVITSPVGIPPGGVGGNVNLIAAAGNLSALNAVSLMLSGHIHTFEAINYDGKVPPQVVDGNGGDNLDVTPKDLHGAFFQGGAGVHVKDGLSVGGFGFLTMTRDADSDGWAIQLYDSAGMPGLQCQFESGRVFCLKAK